jgi:hypothetical protein
MGKSDMSLMSPEDEEDDESDDEDEDEDEYEDTEPLQSS